MNNISLRRLYFKSAIKSSLINIAILIVLTYVSLQLFNLHEVKQFASSIRFNSREIEQVKQFLVTGNQDALDLFFIEKKSTHNLVDIKIVSEFQKIGCKTEEQFTVCSDKVLRVFQSLDMKGNKFIKMSSNNFKPIHGLYFYSICFFIFIFNIFSAYLSSLFAQREIRRQVKEIEDNGNVVSQPRIHEFQKLSEIILKAQNSILNSAVARSNIKLIKKLQHDIDSPLTSLEFFMLEARNSVTEDLRLMGRQSLNRIQDIINTLKINEEESILEESSNKEIIAIYPLLKRIVSEKRIEYKNRPDVHISLDSIASKDYFLEIRKSDFNRAISNIINNSVEAQKPNSPIYIVLHVERTDEKVSIIISDNGIGIEKKYLNDVFEYGKSFNKNSTGIGLNQAKDYIESENGELLIESNPDQGTVLKISLYEVEAPAWYTAKIKLSSKQVVIVDDDESIHKLWNEKLNPFQANLVHLYSSKEFDNWAIDKDLKEFNYLIDLELIGSLDTGINLINAYQLHNRSTLVTSHFLDLDVQEMCSKFGIKMIPKESVLNIAVSFTKQSAPKEVVLIDDDKFTHLNWKRSAKNSDIKFSSYFSVEEFISSSTSYDKSTSIYIDSDLGESLKGEELSKEIFDLGFKNIYLATGKRREDIKVPYWIKKVQGKGFYVQ